MSTSYFSTITNESAFKTHFQQENGMDFMDIKLVGASEWGRGHLFACRVIRRPTQRSVLPVLSNYTRPSDSKSSPEIINFVNGPPDLTYMTQSEHQLEDYIDSGTMQVDSSSPREISSQETSSAGYVDSESHMLLASPEDETLRLASCVIRHILYFGTPQDSVDLGTVVEFRDAKVRIAVQSPLLNRKIVAIDDGGLCLRKEFNGRFELIKNHLAILEGKRQFQCLEDGRPVISDDCLAQMTCEALVVAAADPSEELHRNGAFLYVNSTPWFDLDSQSGRKQVVANLCGLMRRERDA
ncbi:uncharacterized protein PGRI_081070 [Penicillium griseofulvum]|uniref:Uncharacterized protein n=1 Tax=Penicillium patulum TaxID=5078 RepID=A0A135LVB9_PENPA|nr:uncharacterized protein PGRI_081070 [Penicillium griseofulvum]KXG52851.1 hypothetical protein PGRI_081070 [Penicillium griseofulvum]